MADSVDVLERMVYGPHNEAANMRADGDAIHPLPALVRELFVRAREARRNDLLTQWKRNYRTMHNREWKPALNPWDEPVAVNQVFPVVASCVAWMTDQRPNLEVEATAEEYTDQWGFYDQLARDMNVCMQAGFRNHLIDGEIAMALWDVKQYGIGYLKTVWEPWLADGLGDATARRVDPWTIYPDPHARGMKDLTYIIEAKTMTVDDADRTWPGAAKLIAAAGFLEDTDEAPHRLDDAVSSRRPRAALAAIGGNYIGGGPVPAGQPDNYARSSTSRFKLTDRAPVTVLECYYRSHHVEDSDTDGVKKVWDEWRCVVISGNVILMDEACSDINSFGGHPYDRLVSKDMGEWYGPCLVEQLAPIQRLINRIIGSICRNIDWTGNPVLKEDPGSASRNKRTRLVPGERLQGLQVEWLQPPNANPQQAMQVVEFLKGEIESVSGLSAMVRGFAPAGRNSQGVLDSVQDAAFVRVRDELRELERTLRGVTSKIASFIAEFYDETRKLSLLGADGRKTHLAVRARHFYVLDPDDKGKRVPLRFSIAASAGSELPTSKQARSAESKHLFELGVIDDVEVLKASGWPGYLNVVQRNRETQAAQASMAAAAGKLTK